jgi:hypothetical protein
MVLFVLYAIFTCVFLKSFVTNLVCFPAFVNVVHLVLVLCGVGFGLSNAVVLFFVLIVF